jgi:hypothetical protein
MGNAASRAPFSCFVERTQEPGRRTVLKALAEACAAWEHLEAHLADIHRLKGSFYYMYGERYGWALRFRRGGRTILAMYPNRGHLTVQIILGKTQVAAAKAMSLPPRVSKVLEAAKDYPEGRWLFIPVKSRKSAHELRPLIALKLSRPRSSHATGRA